MIYTQSRASGKSLYAVKKLREAWNKGMTTLMMCGGFMKFEDYAVIYTYKCKRGHVFEKEMAISALATAKVSCPQCLTNKVFRIITSAPQVQFKGSGFYSTDNKK